MELQNVSPSVKPDQNWRDTFYKMTGTKPEDRGITTEEQANKAILAEQKLRSAQAGPGLASVDRSYGNVGTRNEAIYPTK